MADTWIDPEERCYPNGGFKRRARVRIGYNEHHPVKLPYGQLRMVRCAIPDTYFSIPARFRYRGKTVKGYVSYLNDELTFAPDANPLTCPTCKMGEGCRKDVKAEAN